LQRGKGDTPQIEHIPKGDLATKNKGTSKNVKVKSKNREGGKGQVEKSTRKPSL
jgi:hypothetical protein